MLPTTRLPSVPPTVPRITARLPTTGRHGLFQLVYRFVNYEFRRISLTREQVSDVVLKAALPFTISISQFDKYGLFSINWPVALVIGVKELLRNIWPIVFKLTISEGC